MSNICCFVLTRGSNIGKICGSRTCNTNTLCAKHIVANPKEIKNCASCNVLFTSNTVNVCAKCSRKNGEYVRAQREREKAFVARAKEIIEKKETTDDPILLTRIKELQEKAAAREEKIEERRAMHKYLNREWRAKLKEKVEETPSIPPMLKSSS